MGKTELDEKLQNPNNIANRLNRNPFHEDKIKVVRKPEEVQKIEETPKSKRLTPEEKALLAVEARTVGQGDLAKKYGVTQANVSYHKRNPNELAIATMDTVRNKAVTLADKILGLISDHPDLKDLSPIQLSVIVGKIADIAKDHNVIINQNTDNRQILVYTPENKNESNYEVIEVDSKEEE